MKLEMWLAFVIGAVLSWGTYVPILHEGQMTIGGARETRSMRAFLCVGIAYFLTAVVIPLALMLIQGQKLEFNPGGATFATLGGIAGAAGALCIILAIGAGGSPLYVAPLVFAGAPIMSTLVSLLWKTREVPGPLFFVGLVMAAVGAGLVLYSKSSLDRQHQAAPPAQAAALKSDGSAANPTPAVPGHP